MTHPSNHGGLGSLLNRDSLRSSYRAATYRRGMVRYCMGHAIGKLRVGRMKFQERQDCGEKVVHILRLNLLAPPSIGLPFLGVTRRGPLGLQFTANSIDGCCRCPDTLGENPPTLPLLDQPVLASLFDTSCQSRIAGRQEFPVLG
jgi:hypothetical protein